jgi:HAE1 family hydrophobic/amphiphilic exporter-1
VKLAEISIRRPVFAVMLVLSLVVFGVVAYGKIGVDLFPNVEFPVVTVTVVYPGADPATMESKVADPIEETVNTMSGIKILRSVNLESVTQIIVQFDLEISADKAMQEIRDKVSAIAGQLPAGIDPPQIQKFDVGAAPIMSVALSGNIPIRVLSDTADDVVKERLQRIKGVGSVEIVGGRDRQIQVLIRPTDLAGLGLTVQDIAGALQSQNLELPAGHIESGQREFSIKTKGEVRSVAEIRDLVIGNFGGAIVHVRDVADVVDGAEEARSYSSTNGEQALALIVQKQSGANTVEVSKLVKAEIESMRAQVEKTGARISVPSDSAPYIEHSIDDVKFDLLFGAVLAVIIILFFLHDFRATLISAVALPTAVIATFAFISYMGFTFNNMTMLGLSLSIGILIDDAIVVIENIYRHLEMGKSPMQAAQDATSEIGLAVMATTFSIIAVFVPVAVMKGIIGRFFFQFGLTVSFAVLVSLLVAFTLTPMLSSRFLRGHGGHTVADHVGPGEGKRPNFLVRFIEWFLDSIERVYKRLLGAALKHRAITLGIAFAAMIASCGLVGQVKKEFVPPEDRAEFEVTVELPTGTSLKTSGAYVDAVAEDIRKSIPDVSMTFVTVGSGAQGQVNLGSIRVDLKPAKERKFSQEQAMAWVRERYKGSKDAVIAVQQINQVGGGGFKSQPVQFNIRGKNPEALVAAADAMVKELKSKKGFVDVDTSYRTGKPEISIDPDRERAAALDIPTAAIATTVRALVAGDKVTELKEGLDVYDVTVSLPDKEKNGLAGLQNLKVRSKTGQLVDLSNVVKVTPSEGPSQIDRQARQRQITIYANLEGVPLGEATSIVEASAAKVVPPSLTTDQAGMSQIMTESFGYMGTALMLAIIIVYMILAAQFDSFVHPLTIMLSLPMAVVGAFGGLYLTGKTLNIFSMIGLIMLMGLVVKNAILLVDYANHEVGKGKSVKDALMSAGPVRLRPILMTTAAMIFGMLPVALALGEGGETRSPMAVVVIGGLITSTLLTLVVVPVVYSLVEGMTHSRPMRFFNRLIFGDVVTGATPHAPGVTPPATAAADSSTH